MTSLGEAQQIGRRKGKHPDGEKQKPRPRISPEAFTDIPRARRGYPQPRISPMGPMDNRKGTVDAWEGRCGIALEIPGTTPGDARSGACNHLGRHMRKTWGTPKSRQNKPTKDARAPTLPLDPTITQ